MAIAAETGLVSQ